MIDENDENDENLENLPPSSTSIPSPLNEAEPESLDELFNRIDKKLIAGIPREITDYEISRVVAYLRSQREKFIQDEMNNIKPSRARSTGAKPVTKSLIDAIKNATDITI